ncbi:MAG: hypothetical protein M0Z60_07960 [Nitrospiraceae bacterium]|nr:hypothetical protein [Nitrospiraceae bacterium]
MIIFKNRKTGEMKNSTPPETEKYKYEAKASGRDFREIIQERRQKEALRSDMGTGFSVHIEIIINDGRT